VRPVTGSRAHDPKRLPSSQLLRARTPLVSKPPTPNPRAFETGAFWASTPRDPRAFARRPGVTRRLWDGSVFALHRFTRSRRTATVRGVSAKLLRARSRVPGVPSGYRAPRPRCIRPTSTHPSSRPREPASSCDPDVDTRLAPCIHTLTPRAWRHRGTSHRSSNIAARRTVKRAPRGLDLPMRETGEPRASRHANRFGQPPRMRWSFVRRPSEGVIDRSSDPPSPPPIPRLSFRREPSLHSTVA
jgi:hypothetical protein